MVWVDDGPKLGRGDFLPTSIVLILSTVIRDPESTGPPIPLASDHRFIPIFRTSRNHRIPQLEGGTEFRPAGGLRALGLDLHVNPETAHREVCWSKGEEDLAVRQSRFTVWPLTLEESLQNEHAQVAPFGGRGLK